LPRNICHPKILPLLLLEKDRTYVIFLYFCSLIYNKKKQMTMIKFLNENRFRKLFLGCCLAILSITILDAQNSNPNSPKLYCLDVRDNGTVAVRWGLPDDRTNFNKYEVWCATGSPTAPYSKATEDADPMLIGFDNNGINGMIGTYYHFIRQVKNDGSFFDSDTLSNQFKLFATDNYDGTITLSWTPPRSPLLPEDAPQYVVCKKNPGVSSTSAWDNEVGRTNVNTFTYKDTAMICNDTLRYKVLLACRWQGASCDNGSRMAKVLVKDMFAPKVPVLDSVSVVNGQIVLGWQPSKSTDAGSYIIYINANGLWVAVDTVYGRELTGRDTTYWVDPINDPSSGVYQYRIAAMDTCGHSSPMIDLEQHNILLNLTAKDECAGTVDLAWNSYSNMTGGLSNYQIWMSKNSGAYTLVGQSSTTTYHYSGLQNHNHYDFKVKAVNVNGKIKASSNLITFDVDFEQKADLCYIIDVSVMNDTYVDIEILTSGDTVPFNNIELYKSEDNGITFNLLTTLPYLSGQPLYYYTDMKVNPDEKSYYYKAIVYGACSPAPATSNIAHTIWLQGETNASHINTLKWNNYGKWDGVIDRFTVFRKGETDGIFIPVNDLLPNATYNTYSDDVSDMFNFGSLFQYQVTAYESGNQYGITASSTSNVIDLQQIPATYIPNAFTPNRSINNVFQPMNSFVPLSDYHFYIYNRYGSLIFFSNNPYEGWDGYAKNGKMVMPGVYVWRIKYSYDRDKLYDNVGTVTVIH
jgi:gliding motility-associated-like protein